MPHKDQDKRRKQVNKDSSKAHENNRTDDATIQTLLGANQRPATTLRNAWRRGGVGGLIETLKHWIEALEKQK